MSRIHQFKYFVKGVLLGLISVLALSSQSYSEGFTDRALQPSILPLTVEECQILIHHRPSDDVAFQPGVSVDGDPVAPADLPGSPEIDLPDVVSFDLLLRPRGPGGLLLEGSVGALSVDVTGGAVILNGQRLDDQSAVIHCADTPQIP